MMYIYICLCRSYEAKRLKYTRLQLLLLFIDAGLGATLGGKLALRAGGRRQTVPDALTGALDRVLH